MGKETKMDFNLDSYDWDSKIKEQIENKSSKFVEDATFWKPDKNLEKTYVIRFIPDVNTKMNWIEVNTHNINHFPDDEKKFVSGTCVKTKGSGEKCKLCNYGWNLWKTNIKANQDKAKSGGWIPKQEWVSNILVIKDPVNPDNNGKVFKFKYGVSIYKLIVNRFEPDEASKSDDDFVELNPFHPFEGANFKLKVMLTEGVIGGKKITYPDYKGSSFYNEKTPISTKKKEIEDILKCTYNLKDYVNELKYLTTEYINEEFGYLLSSNTDSSDSTNTYRTEKNNVPDDDDDIDNESSVEEEKDVEVTQPKKTSKKNSKPKETSDEDLNEEDLKFLNDL